MSFRLQILLQTIIPISLYVSMKMVKLYALCPFAPRRAAPRFGATVDLASAGSI